MVETGSKPSATARLPDVERAPGRRRPDPRTRRGSRAAPPGDDVRRPAFVVGQRDVLGVAAVDEQEARAACAHAAATGAEWPTTATTTSSSPAASIVRRKNGSVSMRPVSRIDDLAVVVLPPGLVLLRAAVMVDGEQHRARRARRRAEVHGRLPAVRADLEQRTDRAGRRARRRAARALRRRA